jgi:hypothetical protein
MRREWQQHRLQMTERGTEVHLSIKQSSNRNSDFWASLA